MYKNNYSYHFLCTKVNETGKDDKIADGKKRKVTISSKFY